MVRHRLPTNRLGSTYTIEMGDIQMEFTVNNDAKGAPKEIFCKCRSEEGYQGTLEGTCILASLLRAIRSAPGEDH